MSILSSVTRQRLLECLYSALSEPVGTVVAVSNVPEGKRKLMDARKDSGDFALDQVQIKTSPFHPDTDIWLVKREKNFKQKEEPDGREEDGGTLPVDLGKSD